MKRTFQRLSQNIEIKASERYPIPENTTHIGVKNGRLAFFRLLGEDWSNLGVSRNHRRYWQHKLGSSFVSFPEFFRANQGWQYGKPIFE